MTPPPWTRFLSWIALALFIVVALLNLSGQPDGWWFLLPVGLALVGLVIGVRARRRWDIVISGLVVLALPVWLLGLLILIQFVRLPNDAFSP
jgi:hypothetical protein